jgi:hypothetical protein
MIAAPTATADPKRATRILAKSLVKEMTAQGYTEKQIVALATELLSEVTTRMSAPAPTD